MKRILIMLMAFCSIAIRVAAESFSVSLSLNSLEVDTQTILVKTEERLAMNCEFTADVSMGLESLQTILNNQLSSAGITSLEISNLREHMVFSKSKYFLTLYFSPLGMNKARIFNLTMSSGTTRTITLVRDTDDILDSFELNGSWASDSSDNFSLSLSGSQPGVTYILEKDGATVRSMTGTGQMLSFGNFYGMSSHGNYQVIAQYKDWEEQVVGTIRMVRSHDIGGNNYTAVRVYSKADGSDYYTDVTYYNGLGYPAQKILLEGASDNMNLVQPIVYDEMMRAEAKEYLPYPSTEDTGRYIEDVLSAHQDFYHNDDRPFAENTFESGSSGRLLTSQKPGDIYEEMSKNASFKYGINDGNEGVLELRYNYAGSSNPASVTKIGYYDEERLYYTMEVSEDNDTSYVFSDIFDKTILRRDLNDGINHDTYFIYDLKDSLVCVIQPEGSARIGNSFTFNDSFCNNYCFTYQYDERGNIIEKQIPGSGKELMAYDMRNRMILYADAEMQINGKYKYILYDPMDRVIQEGYASLNDSIENVRNAQRGNISLSYFITDKQITRTLTYYGEVNAPTLSIPSNSRAYRADINYGHCLTLPAVETIYEEPYFDGNILTRGASVKTKKYFYDSKGRLTLMTEEDNDGWKSIYSWKNDFLGNVLKYTEEHYKGNMFDSMVTTYTYDKRGRRLTMLRNINGTNYAIVSYDYDDYGRVRVKDVAGRGTEVYGYNLQGWQESSAAFFYGYDVFSQTINYQIPFMDMSEARFDGMISEVRSRHLDQDIQTVGYYYDGLGRLCDTHRFYNWDQSPRNIWTEKIINYDKNGNITSMSRYMPYSSANNSFSYDGNKLINSVNGGSSAAYSYYANGNLKNDSRRDLQFRYNLLNLPSVVTDASGQTVKVRYSYLADGTKLSVRDAQNDGLSYRGSFVYKVDGAAGSTVVTERLESIAHDEGRFLALSASAGATTTQFIDTWHIKDYLGSVRTVLDITRDTSKVSDPTIAILEQNDYLPFGIRIDLDSLAYDQSNRYRFNGKEEQITGNIGLTDYGARFYDNVLPRWTTPDPLAEKYYGISPYAFCNNNPVNFVDPDGEAWGKATKIVKKIYKTAKAGEKISVKGILKSEWVDIADNARTIFDSDASLFEKGIAAFDLATGFGDEAKWLAKTVGVSDAIVDGAKASNKKSKLQKTAEIGQEAHRQIEKELKISIPGTKTEVRLDLIDKSVRKDAVLPDGTLIIIKPDTPSGHKAAARRDKMMKNNGYKTQIIFYDPTDSRWLPDSPTYIGPKY